MAKPFVKWAGGKRKLLPTLDQNLPKDLKKAQKVTYIEPFVGGGAMLFYMLECYPNIQRVIINDINPALINCYRKIQQKHKELIEELQALQSEFYRTDDKEDWKSLYYERRKEYNNILPTKRNTLRAAALFIFFNKTCFNGLYRENNNGDFNVPFGRYVHPNICQEQCISEAHEALKTVEILDGEYSNVLELIDWDEYNFFYLDPPYRPLLGSNNFKQYTKNSFNDSEQEELKSFCDTVNSKGGHFLLSNSDSEIASGENYFEKLYQGYTFQRIEAPRFINAFAAKRSHVPEILIKNY